MSAQIPIETPGTGSVPETPSASGPDKHDTSIGTLIFEGSSEDSADASPASSPEPPLRVESLHASKYCERLFYFQEVEQITVAQRSDSGDCVCCRVVSAAVFPRCWLFGKKFRYNIPAAQTECTTDSNF